MKKHKSVLKCPVCSSTRHANFSTNYDDRYGYPGTFNIWKCLDCGHRYLATQFSKNEINDIYTGCYPNSQTKVSDFKPFSLLSPFNRWISGNKSKAYAWVTNNSKVLDIGCGIGQSLGYYESLNCEAYGIDPDKNLKKIGKAFNYNVKIGMFSSSRYKKNFFDYVVMDQVIEHIQDPVKFLSDVKKVLAPGGKIIMSTPNFSGWSCKLLKTRSFLWHVPYHLQFFDEQSMILCLKKAGYSKAEANYQTNTEWILYQLCHYFSVPKKGQTSEYLDYPRTPRKITTKLFLGVILAIHMTKITVIFSKIIDRFNSGDNVVYIAQK